MFRKCNGLRQNPPDIIRACRKGSALRRSSEGRQWHRSGPWRGAPHERPPRSRSPVHRITHRLAHEIVTKAMVIHMLVNPNSDGAGQDIAYVAVAARRATSSASVANDPQRTFRKSCGGLNRRRNPPACAPRRCGAALPSALANYCQRVRGPACDRRFGTIAREMILERAANAQREAGPDRRTEIKRHPGNLVLPLSKVVRHDPTRAHVTETLKRSQKLAAVGNRPPSSQVHRDVDGHEKRQIACNPDDCDGEDHANRTIKLR